MMFDTKGLLIVALILAVIGAVPAFGLWAFRVVPAWAILVGAIGVPPVILALLFVLFMGAWVASGSH